MPHRKKIKYYKSKKGVDNNIVLLAITLYGREPGGNEKKLWKHYTQKVHLRQYKRPMSGVNTANAFYGSTKTIRTSA